MDSRVDDFELTADVDVAGQAHSSLMLAFSSAQVPGAAIAQLQLTGEGNAARHALALTTTTSVGTAELGLIGKVANPWTRGFAWSFELDKATHRVPGARPVGAPRTCHWPRHEDGSRARPRPAGRATRRSFASTGTRGPARTEAQFALSQLRFDYFAALLADARAARR